MHDCQNSAALSLQKQSLAEKYVQPLQFITFRYASTVDGSTNEMSKTIKLFVAFIYFAGPQKWLLYFT